MPSEPSPEERELIGIIERDYAVTQETTASAENALVASRSIGFTLVAALLGVGLGQKSWPIVALAAVTGFAAYLVDGYYTWRVTERREYLKRLERALAANYRAIERAPGNEKELNKLAAVLNGIRIGSNFQIRRFRYRDVFYNQPGTLFWLLYPVLIVAALTATGVLLARTLNANGSVTPLSKCSNGVRLSLTSSLQIQIPPGAPSAPTTKSPQVAPRVYEVTVPAAEARCR